MCVRLTGPSLHERKEDNEEDDLVDIMHEVHHDKNGTNGKIHPNPRASPSFTLVCLYSGINQSHKRDALFANFLQPNFANLQYKDNLV